MAWCFPIRYFLCVVLSDLQVYFYSGPSSSPCNFFRFNVSIRNFYYVISVPIFYSKIVLLPLHPVVGMSSCILLLLFGGIFFRCFGKFCFVCIGIPCLVIFYVSPLSLIFFDLSLQAVFSDLAAVLLWSFHPNISPSFSVCLHLCVLFMFLFGSLEAHRFYHLLISLPH